MVKVVPPEENTQRRTGFLEGLYTVPKDFKEMGRAEMEAMFYAEE